MQATSDFFRWWYEAGGIGGWIFFFILDIAVIAWLIYDSQTRRIRAVGWLLGAILPTLLLIPSAIFGFSPTTRVLMQDLQEIFFYLGLIGGIVPLVVAVGYFITYRGLRGCEDGHVYDASLRECPVCAQARIRITPPPPPPPERRQQPPPGRQSGQDQGAPPRRKPTANGWLVDETTNRSYQLYQGDTRVGRRKDTNDLVFPDKAISRDHMLIREEQGIFTIHDRGSKTGTFVAGTRVESPEMLHQGDVIEIGDTRVAFMTTHQ